MNPFAFHLLNDFVWNVEIRVNILNVVVVFKFLVYVMLLSPSLQQMAHADTAYSSLDTSTWGGDNTTIEYEYDANG